jgi:hypothetical protein
MVIEEIKLELAGQGNPLFPGISRPGYVDPFTRTDMTVAQANQAGDKIQIKGANVKESFDDAQIIINSRKAQAQVDTDAEFVRHSTQTALSKRRSLTESEILGAVTDVIMAQMGRGDVAESIASFQLNQSMERRIGEDLVLEKINKIFDEVAKDREQFESGFIDLSQKGQSKHSIHDQSAQVHDASLFGTTDQAPAPNKQVPLP